MKNTQRSTLVSILLIGLFTACLGYAEDSRVSVRTLAVEEDGMPVWYLGLDGGEYQELKWPVEQPSASIVTTAGQELLLFSKETNAEGVVEFKVVRKLAIPAAADQLLLVAWPIDGDEKVGLMMVADDFDHASTNDWMVINTSKNVVTLRYGADSQAIQLEPSEAKPCRIASKRGHGSAVLAQVMLKGELKTVYSTYWAAPEKQRSLVLFYNKDNRVKLHRVIDLLEPRP